MLRSCPPGRRGPRHRLALAALAAVALCAAAAPAAHAADLILLNGEQGTLAGAYDFGIVYVDGELRLTGDTTISAGSVYIGPNANLRTCYVARSGDTCTARRSLAIPSATTPTIEPGLGLTGRPGPPRPGGALTLGGGDAAVGGQIPAAGSGAAWGRGATAPRGTATTGPITAYGAPVTISA